MLLRKIVALAAGVLVLGGCGDDPVGSADAQNNLVFTRQDGSRADLGNRFNVWCDAWEPGEVAAPTVWVLARGEGESGWILKGVRADVGGGQPVTFPLDFPFDQPRGAQFFVNDGENELSSSEPESSGSLTFQEVSCERGGTVRFTVDAVLGSEFGNGPSMRVAGSFQGTVGPRPF